MEKKKGALMLFLIANICFLAFNVCLYANKNANIVSPQGEAIVAVTPTTPTTSSAKEGAAEAKSIGGIRRDTEYKLFYGEWEITRLLDVHPHEQYRHDSILGQRMYYDADLFLSNGMEVTKDPVYHIRIVPALDFAPQSHMKSPAEMGLAGNYYAFVSISNTPFVVNDMPVIGDFFFIKDDETLIVSYYECYYEAKRVRYAKNGYTEYQLHLDTYGVYDTAIPPTPPPPPTPTPLPTSNVKASWPALCTHRDCYWVHARDNGVQIGVSELPFGGVAHTCNGTQGTAVFIDGVQVYGTTDRYIENYADAGITTFQGREVAEISFTSYAKNIFPANTKLYLFDAKTGEIIGQIDGEEVFEQFRYDEATHTLDISALPENITQKGKCLPRAAQLYLGGGPKHCYIAYWNGNRPVMGMKCGYPYGDIEVEYAYENGAFVPIEIRQMNDDAPNVYAPLPGKVMELRVRAVDDGLMPAVEEGGTELLLDKKRLDYYPDLYLQANKHHVFLYSGDKTAFGIRFAHLEEGYADDYSYNLYTMEGGFVERIWE